MKGMYDGPAAQTAPSQNVHVSDLLPAYAQVQLLGAAA